MVEKKIVALEDVQLAKKAQTEPAAAEMLLRRLQPKIFQVVRSCVRSPAQVEEIGQNVALEVLKSLHSFRGEGSIEAWAGGIAYRTAMKSLRNEINWAQAHTEMNEEMPSTSDSPENNASKMRLYESLKKKLGTLPGERRTSIILHLVHGYTVKEISDMLNVSPNTTKGRLKTGLRELRQIFERNPALSLAIREEMR